MPKRRTKKKLPPPKKLPCQNGDEIIEELTYHINKAHEVAKQCTGISLEVTRGVMPALTASLSKLSGDVAALNTVVRSRTPELPVECLDLIIQDCVCEGYSRALRLVCKLWRDLVDSRLQRVVINKCMPTDFSRFRDANTMVVANRIIRRWDTIGQAAWDAFVACRRPGPTKLVFGLSNFSDCGNNQIMQQPITVNAHGANLILRGCIENWVAFKSISPVPFIRLSFSCPLKACSKFDANVPTSCCFHRICLSPNYIQSVVEYAHAAVFRVRQLNMWERQFQWHTRLVHFCLYTNCNPTELCHVFKCAMISSFTGPYEVHVWSDRPQLLRKLMNTLDMSDAFPVGPTRTWDFYLHCNKPQPSSLSVKGPRGSITIDQLLATYPHGPDHPWVRQADLIDGI